MALPVSAKDSSLAPTGQAISSGLGDTSCSESRLIAMLCEAKITAAFSTSFKLQKKSFKRFSYAAFTCVTRSLCVTKTARIACPVVASEQLLGRA